MKFKLDCYHLTQELDHPTYFLTPDELYRNSNIDEKITATNAKFVFERSKHTVVLGLEYEIGKVRQRIDSGPQLLRFGVPPRIKVHPEREKWAIFLNDSIVLDKLSITPGIRYDHDDINSSFISPSLGLTYEIGEYSIFRASIAKGFTSPPLAFTSGGGIFLDPNPSLEEEKVWSYQVGIETKALNYLWLKSTLFHHDMDNALVKELYGSGAPSYNDIYVNKGKVSRRGGELEFRTLPIHSFVIKVGLAYAHTKDFESSQKNDSYTIDLGLSYDDGKSFRGEILGHYSDFGYGDTYPDSDYDFIWDIHLNKHLTYGKDYNTMVFLSAHNIFNGSYYTFEDTRNPERWVEAGLRVKF